MNALDRIIIDFFNTLFPHNEPFYHFVHMISGTNLLKGGVLIMILWYLWFFRGKNNEDKKIRIIITLMASFVALVISRVITIVLPFQARPILNPELHYFDFPTNTTSIDNLSSFPSDHAVLFIALATGIWFISRRTGILAFLYAVIFILCPRIYLGFHYPTDVLAGMILGSGVSIAFMKSRLMYDFVQKKVYPISELRPELFYPCFFLITAQLVVLFSDIRSILSSVGKYI